MIQFSIYNKHLLSFLFSIVFLLWCSCTPTTQPDVEIQGIKPIWGTELPGKAGVYNYGLVGLPLYDGNIMFHSTNFSGIINNVFEEDNRIHALDMKTGEIKWTYPSSYSKARSLIFESEPFQHDSHIVIKSGKNSSALTSKLMCIDQKTGQEVWYKEIPAAQSYNINNNVVGEGADFYYFEQTNKNAILCKGNIISGETSSTIEIQSEQGHDFNGVTSNIIYHKNKKKIIAGAWERNTKSSDSYSYKNYLYIIDVENNIFERKLFSDSIDKTMLIARIYCDGDRVFAACGLTTICYNLNTQKIDWTYKSTESYNYMTNDVVCNSDIVFLYGDNRYVGLDAQTGKKLYQGDIQCGNANAFNGYVYVVARDSKLYILDIKTGKTLHRIICPEEYTTNTGFNTYCKPQVYGDKLYVFGNYHAYCYDAVPKEE